MSKRTQYDREFKIEAVRLILESGRTVKSISEELGVNYYTLLDWKREYEQKGTAAFPGAGRVSYATEEAAELARLRKENHRLRMERDILKKAMAISLGKK